MILRRFYPVIPGEVACRGCQFWNTDWRVCWVCFGLKCWSKPHVIIFLWKNALFWPNFANFCLLYRHFPVLNCIFWAKMGQKWAGLGPKCRHVSMYNLVTRLATAAVRTWCPCWPSPRPLSDPDKYWAAPACLSHPPPYCHRAARDIQLQPAVVEKLNPLSFPLLLL